ncbi:MAG: AraC family transcriptional regulator [Ignavibacteriales bacterium]|jgi:AraC-like DNA-binding protein|nr:MAG: AraC family transcriptional regulator [Ignavibacteriales bacterium]
MVNYKKYSDIEIFEGEISRHQYPWHFHDSYTFIVVEKGSVFYELNDRSTRICETEILIIEPFKVHRNIISQTTVYKAFFIPQEYFLREDEKIIMTQEVNNPKEVYHLKNLLNNISHKNSKREIEELISEIVESLCQPKTEQISDMKATMNIIPELNPDLTIDELANKANLSKFHFQRKFKKECGLTIGQLKQQEKTIRAKKLLEKGKQSTDVAYELGFFDQSHFIKYFKKMWAITPKNFK